MRNMLAGVCLSVLIGTGCCAYAPYQTPPKFYPDLSDIGELAVPAKINIETMLPEVAEPVYLVSLPLPVRRPSDLERLPATTLLEVAEKDVGATGRQLRVHNIGLWCAEMINRWLKKVGMRGTNSALAADFAHWGKPSPRPCVGCVAVKRRRGGNHVVIVKKVEGDRIIAISPNGGGDRVKLSKYPAHVFYAFRAPPV
jgi:uncharacterized protein (TIGR02594 family)